MTLVVLLLSCLVGCSAEPPRVSCRVILLNVNTIINHELFYHYRLRYSTCTVLLFLFLVCTHPSFTELLLTATVAKRLAYTEQDAFNYYLMTLAKSCPETSSFAQLPMQCQLLCYLVNSRPNLHIFVENMEDALI